jgi:sigma-E factor negative regulatory protein RseC
MKESIRHQGTVESVCGRRVTVRIQQTAACSSCQIATHCAASESKTKQIEALADTVQSVPFIGQQVTVSTSMRTARLAVALLFGLPLSTMLVVVVTATISQQSEATTALLAIGILIPYYIIIWLCRHRIAHKVTFRIE